VHIDCGAGATDPALVLCADDYGLSPAIGSAVRRLAETGRLGATSCMVAAPAFAAEAALLQPLAGRLDIGLHFQLTDGRPLGRMPRLAPGGRLPGLGRLVGLALAGRLDAAEIAAELERQFDAFEAAFGRPPDHLDGHHHVHQFPGIRTAVLAAAGRRLRPGGWLRRSVMPVADLARHGVAPLRTAVVDLLGAGFRARAAAAGLPGNGGFRGVRDFAAGEDYALLFPRWLDRAPAPLLVMCHPAAAAEPDDPIGACRLAEYRYLASDACAAAVAAAGRRFGRIRLS